VNDQPAAGRFAWGRVAAVAAAVAVGVVVLYVVAGSLTSFKGVPPDEVCVVQEGGLFDGRDVKSVRQPSSGVSTIGIWNSQHCYPVTERTYTLSADASEADAKTVDTFKTPTVDAVQVVIEGQARFTLNSDPKVVEDFYRRYGLKTYGGKYAHDGGEGWENFLAQVLRPVLLNSIREAVGKYRCVELNNTCQYVQNTEAVTEGKIDEVETGQNLDKVGAEVASTLAANLDRTLVGHFFENVRFNLVRIGFEPEVQAAITAAQTKRTEVANARLDAQKAEQEARGRRLAASEDAKAIREKQQAYAENPTQGKIDQLRAICGPDGCHELRVLGGDVSQLVR
jgi:regulator of protease activity HflC (stomatin/prohibitin superfamily)